jgi:hypothetical protein
MTKSDADTLANRNSASAQAAQAMPSPLFRGRWAIALAASVLAAATIGSAQILLGGSPVVLSDGQYSLSDHGELTAVTQSTWLAAHVVRMVLVAAWLSSLTCLGILVLQEMRLPELHKGRDYSRLVLGAFLLAGTLMLLARACETNQPRPAGGRQPETACYFVVPQSAMSN